MHLHEFISSSQEFQLSEKNRAWALTIAQNKIMFSVRSVAESALGHGE